MTSIKSQSPLKSQTPMGKVGRGFSQMQRNRSERLNSNFNSEVMTNIRPSSTFMAVPRYTSAYIATEKCNFEIQQKDTMKTPDPVESYIKVFDSDIPEREKALKEKGLLVNEFNKMYNNTIPYKVEGSDSKVLLISPKIRREEVKNLRENIK